MFRRSLEIPSSFRGSVTYEVLCQEAKGGVLATLRRMEHPDAQIAAIKRLAAAFAMMQATQPEGVGWARASPGRRDAIADLLTAEWTS